VKRPTKLKVIRRNHNIFCLTLNVIRRNHNIFCLTLNVNIFCLTLNVNIFCLTLNVNIFCLTLNGDPLLDAKLANALNVAIAAPVHSSSAAFCFTFYRADRTTPDFTFHFFPFPVYCGTPWRPDL